MYQNGLQVCCHKNLQNNQRFQHFVNQRKLKQKIQNREFSEKTPGRVRTSAREEHELDRSFQPSHENVINDEIGISFEQVREQHFCITRILQFYSFNKQTKDFSHF
jgi:hypothetical protein